MSYLSPCLSWVRSARCCSPFLLFSKLIFKLLYQIWTVQVLLGFPGVLLGPITLPGDEVFHGSIADTLVQQLLDWKQQVDDILKLERNCLLSNIPTYSSSAMVATRARGIQVATLCGPPAVLDVPDVVDFGGKFTWRERMKTKTSLGKLEMAKENS